MDFHAFCCSLKSPSVSTKAMIVIRNDGFNIFFYYFFKCISSTWLFQMVIFVVWDLFRIFFPVLISSIFSKCFTGNKKGFARLMCCENTVSSSLFTLIQETRQKNIISICNAVQQRNRHSNF